MGTCTGVRLCRDHQARGSVPFQKNEDLLWQQHTSDRQDLPARIHLRARKSDYVQKDPFPHCMLTPRCICQGGASSLYTPALL
jgi:hypothetical protein